MPEFTDQELYLLQMAVFSRMATAPTSEYKDLEALLPRLGYPGPDDAPARRPMTRVLPNPNPTWAVGGRSPDANIQALCECGYTLMECSNSEIAAIRCNRRGRS